MTAVQTIKPSVVRCAIYTRKSSEEGLEQDFNSLHAQREACQAYVLSQIGEGWIALPHDYDDGGFSGGSMERPGLTRLLADVQARQIDVVVVYKVDRLTRSLGDFAKIVDVFDAAGASFVSVTQAFNTTTSMGRLTLNVLLSFAQFEREVTGERIRDKIAASKRKGLWMGGNIAFGYDAKGRSLSINEGEAEIVRHIFRRYVELESVNALRVELEAQGVRSKRCVAASSGKVRGGGFFGRGALFHLLANRLYLGEIPHKGEFHPGQHPAIIETEIFDRVQAMLARQAGPKRRRRSGLEALTPDAPLTGLIFDDRGHRMAPVTGRKGEGPLYRYYVSSAHQRGRASEAGSMARVPAGQVESLVLDRARKIGLVLADEPEPWARVRAGIVKVVPSRGLLRIVISRTALESAGEALDVRLRRLEAKDQVELTPQALIVCVGALLSRRGQAKLMVGPGGLAALQTSQVDTPLLRALVQGEAWKRRLLTRKALTIAEIARSEGVGASQCERLIRLAFLAPDLKHAVLEGRAPAGLMLERLKKTGIPDDWAEQRRLFQHQPPIR